MLNVKFSSEVNKGPTAKQKLNKYFSLLSNILEQLVNTCCFSCSLSYPPIVFQPSIKSFPHVSVKITWNNRMCPLHFKCCMAAYFPISPPPPPIKRNIQTGRAFEKRWLGMRNKWRHLCAWFSQEWRTHVILKSLSQFVSEIIVF